MKHVPPHTAEQAFPEQRPGNDGHGLGNQAPFPSGQAVPLTWKDRLLHSALLALILLYFLVLGGLLLRWMLVTFARL